MARPSDIEDPIFRAALEEAERLIDEGDYTKASRKCAETYLLLLDQRPDLIPPPRAGLGFGFGFGGPGRPRGRRGGVARRRRRPRGWLRPWPGNAPRLLARPGRHPRHLRRGPQAQPLLREGPLQPDRSPHLLRLHGREGRQRPARAALTPSPTQRRPSARPARP